MNDWIHTIRGVTLVEGTLPSLVRAIEKLVKLLAQERKIESWECQSGTPRNDGVPNKGAWEPFGISDVGVVWRRPVYAEKE